MRLTAVTLAAAALLSSALLASPARADVTHVVQRGHTIEAIAHRYHVTVKSILEANHLADARHLKPGQTLVIPGVESKHKGEKEHGEKDRGEKSPKAEAQRDREERRDREEKRDHAGKDHKRAAIAALEPALEPRGRTEGDGTIHALRLGEEYRVKVKDGHGHIPTSALKAFERMMRQGNATHAVDPRLVALVGIVSGHFGGKPIEVVSGYRAYTPTQYTPHSNHNLGKALDFRIRGVSNETLRDFCRTLRSAGCGYYPNSTFVHLDVRETKAYWVDYSHPGEAPKYDKPGVEADEGASDVPEENPAPPPAATQTPGEGAGSNTPPPPAATTTPVAPAAPAN